MGKDIRHNKFKGYQTYIFGKLVCLCVPARAPKYWLPFIEEVVGMCHTMLLKDIIKDYNSDVDIHRLGRPIQQHSVKMCN